MTARLFGGFFAAVVGFTLVVSSANAALIDGSLSLSGGFTPVNSSYSAVSLGSATGIAFDSNATVDQGVGDFASTAGHAATMTDFQFAPLSPNPVDVWSVDGFTFSMDSVTLVFQNATFLLLSGTGTVTGTGYDATPGNWEFSGQTANQATFSWSSSSATAVPVPAAMWLFGTGLLGMAGFSRRSEG